MALQQVHENKLCCSICLKILKDPVVSPCGHSFCRICITNRWDKEELERIYSCPNCGHTFTSRPTLVTNVTLADLVEAMDLQAPADDCANSGDVACDFCIEKKLKAVKSCLVCRVSYCLFHLKPHHESLAFEKHKLIKPSENLQEQFCPRHDEVMKVFCRTDRQLICFLCAMDEHKNHNMVSVVTERKKKQRELGERRQEIQQRIQDQEKDLEVLRKEIKAINCSADKAVEESLKIFAELVSLVEEKSSIVKEQIRSQQEKEVCRVKELKKKLEEEVAKLRRKDTELEQLFQLDDHLQFLHQCPSLSYLDDSLTLPAFNTHHLRHFEGVATALSEAQDELQRILNQECLKVSLNVTEVDVLLQHPEPETREEFLQYRQSITLNPNTANPWLSLSDGNRKTSVTREKRCSCSHPDTFSDWLQVLGKESLTGRCYWEVERSGGVGVAVAFEDIPRSGNESGFGNSDKSWLLGCLDFTCYLRHNGIQTSLPGPTSSRIGVYLDHKAGTLAFYSISDTMTLLHRVQTKFTRPIYAGLWVYWVGDAAKVCELK